MPIDEVSGMSTYQQLNHETPSASNSNSVDNEPPPSNWPEGVHYLSKPSVSPHLTEMQSKWLKRKPQDQTNPQSDLNPMIGLPLCRAEIDERVQIRIIQDEQHPAYGQRGLFASRDFLPGEMIIPYLGYVHSSTVSETTVCSQQISYETRSNIEIGAWDSSSYDLNLYRDGEIELAIDAATQGNEARFCNDYRGVPAQGGRSNQLPNWERDSKRNVKESTQWTHTSSQSYSLPFADHAIPNAEFKDVWLIVAPDEGKLNDTGELQPTSISRTGLLVPEQTDAAITIADQHSSACKPLRNKKQRRQERRKQTGMRGVGIFVLPAGKGGKRKHGIKAGQEILVSYGKGFWSHHQIQESSTDK